MTANLYHSRTPSGSALMIAKAIHAVSPGLDGKEALLIASDLFACAHPKAKPAAIQVRVPEKLAHLKSECAKVGIAVEVA